jgi:hypothetical protein
MIRVTDLSNDLGPQPHLTQDLARDAWPIVPLILVVSGYESGVGPVRSKLAIRDAAGCYRLEGGGLLVPGTGDVIETWEEMTAVPVYRASQIASDRLHGENIQVS